MTMACAGDVSCWNLREDVHTSLERGQEGLRASKPESGKMALRSEVFALIFGALLILVTFGDNHLKVEGGSIVVGNLDTVFGLTLWQAMDVIYFLALIAVFLLYGWTKSSSWFRLKSVSILLFVSFLVVLSLISVDDFAQVLDLSLELPDVYWIVVSWVFPVYSSIVLFIFGRASH